MNQFEVYRVTRAVLIDSAGGRVSFPSGEKKGHSDELRVGCGDPEYRCEQASFMPASDMIGVKAVIAKFCDVNYGSVTSGKFHSRMSVPDRPRREAS
jgi:hypothetical protein